MIVMTAGRPLSPAAAAETHALEMAARSHEADAYAVAQQTVLRELEAVLLRPQYEYPVEALQLTARLRGMADRYRARWEQTS